MKPKADIVEVVSDVHLEQVRALLREYQAGLPEAYLFPDREWRDLPGAYAPPGGTLLHASIASKAAGCVGLRPFPLAGACEMKRLYVKPEYRGSGLGRDLVVAVVHRARELGYHHMRLDSIPASMGAAVELYRQFGFVALAPCDSAATTGLLYMELQL